MPVFANVGGMGEPALMLTVAMALVAAISSFGSAYLAYKAARDKLVYDAEHVKMREEIKNCQEDRVELRAEVVENRKRLAELERRSDHPSKVYPKFPVQDENVPHHE
jgi:uncharacterized protein YlxW (UPF0749 family)